MLYYNTIYCIIYDDTILVRVTLEIIYIYIYIDRERERERERERDAVSALKALWAHGPSALKCL
jgi:hypothetical protein